MASILQAVREWLQTCPLLDVFTEGEHIDWTASTPGNYGIMPTGCSDILTVTDILGCVVKRKQYTMSLYARNWTVDEVVRLENASFLEDFQEWVDQQQAQGLSPKVGDEPEEEEISAQNGMLFQMDEDGQTGLYQIQMSIEYIKHYERGKKEWQ